MPPNVTYEDSGLCYEIGGDDTIRFVDDRWNRFAETNDGAELQKPAILGQPLWNYITDETTRILYEQLLQRVRNGHCVRFKLRCDSPDCRRLLEMSLTGDAEGNVKFETRPIRTETRNTVSLFSRRAQRSQELLRLCAWCNRVDVGTSSATWVEVEDAARRLQLLEKAQLPQITHGICESCYHSMSRTVEGLSA